MAQETHSSASHRAETLLHLPGLLPLPHHIQAMGKAGLERRAGHSQLFSHLYNRLQPTSMACLAVFLTSPMHPLHMRKLRLAAMSVVSRQCPQGCVTSCKCLATGWCPAGRPVAQGHLIVSRQPSAKQQMTMLSMAQGIVQYVVLLASLPLRMAICCCSSEARSTIACDHLSINTVRSPRMAQELNLQLTKEVAT